jgi:hypothetical protein
MTPSIRSLCPSFAANKAANQIYTTFRVYNIIWIACSWIFNQSDFIPRSNAVQTIATRDIELHLNTNIAGRQFGTKAQSSFIFRLKVASK